MARRTRAKIGGAFQPKWIDYTGLGFFLSGLALILLPRRRR